MSENSEKNNNTNVMDIKVLTSTNSTQIDKDFKQESNDKSKSDHFKSDNLPAKDEMSRQEKGMNLDKCEKKAITIIDRNKSSQSEAIELDCERSHNSHKGNLEVKTNEIINKDQLKLELTLDKSEPKSAYVLDDRKSVISEAEKNNHENYCEDNKKECIAERRNEIVKDQKNLEPTIDKFSKKTVSVKDVIKSKSNDKGNYDVETKKKTGKKKKNIIYSCREVTKLDNEKDDLKNIGKADKNNEESKASSSEVLLDDGICDKEKNKVENTNKSNEESKACFSVTSNDGSCRKEEQSKMENAKKQDEKSSARSSLVLNDRNSNKKIKSKTEKKSLKVNLCLEMSLPNHELDKQKEIKSKGNDETENPKNSGSQSYSKKENYKRNKQSYKETNNKSKCKGYLLVQKIF